MVMPAAVAVTITGISSAFWIERRFDLNHAGAEPLHHGFDHVIITDTKALSNDLGRQMTITEMPGQPHEMRWIGPSNFQQLLRGGHHFDQPAILEHQRIAAAERSRLLKIE